MPATWRKAGVRSRPLSTNNVASIGGRRKASPPELASKPGFLSSAGFSIRPSRAAHRVYRFDKLHDSMYGDAPRLVQAFFRARVAGRQKETVLPCAFTSIG